MTRTQTLLLAASLASLAGGTGCTSQLLHARRAPYETVQADVQHDTKQAREDYQRARELMREGICGCAPKLAAAEQKLCQALAADVRFGPAHNALGIVYFWEHKLYLAAWEFEYAARLMQDRYEPLNNLGLVYEAAGKEDRAVAYYMLAREKAPNNPQVIGNLARASLRSGQTVDDVRPVLEDVVATDDRPQWVRWAQELLGLHPEKIFETWEVTDFSENLPEPDLKPQADPDLPTSGPLILPSLEPTDLPDGFTIESD